MLLQELPIEERSASGFAEQRKATSNVNTKSRGPKRPVAIELAQ